jgi:hypothetical protein
MTNTFSVLELSTAHVAEDVARALDALVAMSAAGPSAFDADTDWRHWITAERWADYGWWVWAGQEDGTDLLPPCLSACFDYARERCCDWIRFDRDEEATPDLPQHDW